MFNFKALVALIATLFLLSCHQDAHFELPVADVDGASDDVGWSPDHRQSVITNTQIWLSDSKTELLVAQGDGITSYPLSENGVKFSLPSNQLHVQAADNIAEGETLILDALPFDSLPIINYHNQQLEIIGILDMNIYLVNYPLQDFTVQIRWENDLLFVTAAASNSLPTCTYRGEFDVSSGNAQIETDHGIFLFNQLNNTISIVSDLEILAIKLLKFDQPASQCFLENPGFECNEMVCVVTPEHPEFWDCISAGGTDFCYELVGRCAAVQVGPAFD